MSASSTSLDRLVHYLFVPCMYGLVSVHAPFPCSEFGLAKRLSTNGLLSYKSSAPVSLLHVSYLSTRSALHPASYTYLRSGLEYTT